MFTPEFNRADGVGNVTYRTPPSAAKGFEGSPPNHRRRDPESTVTKLLTVEETAELFGRVRISDADIAAFLAANRSI